MKKTNKTPTPLETAFAEAAVVIERDRCLQIALHQYKYWKAVADKDPDNEALSQIVIGAIGASANIVAEILGLATVKTTATAQQIPPPPAPPSPKPLDRG